MIPLVKPGAETEQMARDIRMGLTAEPKDLSPWPKYFYDGEGSRLFGEITRLPEYYQTRTELSILKEKAREIVSEARCRELVELGSGDATKTHTLLGAMFEVVSPDGSLRYAPLDVSEDALRESARRLLEEYPGLEIRGYVGDYANSLHRLHKETGKDGGRLVIFLGGTIGNLFPERRRSFLREIRAGLRAEDRLLVGVDLVKDRRTLEGAYNDAAGVTARFNKNLLKVLNERLGGTFDPSLFEHRAVYRAEEARIEMWLRSKADQEVYLAAADLRVRFEAGECMRTEISAKFSPESVSRMFAEADLRLLDLYTDERKLFGLAFGARV